MGNEQPNSAKILKFYKKGFSFLNFGDFGRGRRKISRGNFVGEVAFLVGTVAERLIGRLAAAAQADGSASGETELISGWIYDLEIALDEDGAVIAKRDFSWHEFPFEFSLCAQLVGSIRAVLNIWAWTDRLHPTTPEFRL